MYGPQCSMVLRFGLNHIWQQFLQLFFISIQHDSDHYYPTGMRDQTDRSVILEETQLTFIRRWCCAITIEFVHHSDEVFLLPDAFS